MGDKAGDYIIDAVKVKDGTTIYESETYTIQIAGRPLRENSQIRKYLDKSKSL